MAVKFDCKVTVSTNVNSDFLLGGIILIELSAAIKYSFEEEEESKAFEDKSSLNIACPISFKEPVALISER